jgi:short-subunit dehydrogenase
MSGSIVNISSTYGHEGAAGASVYVGSEQAVEGITKSVALEVAKSGIRVNGVAPGPTDTAMLTRFTGTPENKAALLTGVPMGRFGLSEELANAIVFIASDEASFITAYPQRRRRSHRSLILFGRGGEDHRYASPISSQSRWRYPMAHVVKKHSISSATCWPGRGG